MDEKLDEELCKDFPSIFRDRNGDMRETCMMWGMEVGDGWESLVRDICLYIDNAIENAKNDRIYKYKRDRKIDYATDLDPKILKRLKIDKIAVVASQVKEKYGQLCFYYYTVGFSERWRGEIEGAVDMACIRSVKICEQCGERGELRGRGWLFTACENHAKGEKTLKEYQAWEDVEDKKKANES